MGYRGITGGYVFAVLGVVLGVVKKIGGVILLSQKEINSVRASVKPRKIYDGGGLFLLVTPAGGRRWVLKYRIQGREKSLAFGTYPDVSLKLARERRDEARALLASGVDPSLTQDSRGTVRTMAEAWLSIRAACWSLRHVTRVRASLEHDVYPRVGSRPLASMKAGDWLLLLREIEARGAHDTAHRVLQRIGSIYRYAIIIGAADSNPVAGMSGALKPAKATHFKTVRSVDIPELLRAIEGYPGDAVTCWALRLAWYTFARSGELRNAAWADIDLEGQYPVWVVPAEKMKMKREQLIPLSRQAVEILREARRLTGHQQWVLPSRSNRRTPISGNTLLFALYRLGYQGRATVHGIRATASTLLNELGWPADAIERQLAHSPADKVRAAYHRSEYLPERRRMMQTWADYLDGLRTGVPVSGSPG